MHFGGAQRHFPFQPMTVLARHVCRQIGLLALIVAAQPFMAPDDEQAQQQHMQHGAQGGHVFREHVDRQHAKVAQERDQHA
ncbi:hypothetical protein D3C71_1379040 [compost metagenome]